MWKNEDSGRLGWAYSRPCLWPKQYGQAKNMDDRRPTDKSYFQCSLSWGTGPISLLCPEFYRTERSVLYLTPFKVFSQNKIMPVKSHSMMKEQEHFLSVGKKSEPRGCSAWAEQPRSETRGSNSILYYRDAQSTPTPIKCLQSEINCFSLANSHTRTLYIQFILLIHRHKTVYSHVL